jgi:hypothetical protein
MAKRVTVDIKTRGAAKASKDLGKVDKGLGRLARSAIATAGAFFGARMLLDGFRSVVEKTKEQALVEAQLNAVLKSTAGVAGLTSKELLKMASALQKQTRFGDEAIIKAQSLMLTFTKVGKEVFPDAIETVLNMGEAMGQDLQQSVIQVGKALNDPIQGISALSRVGVQLSEEQEQSIRDFMAVNDVASAQKIILGELETQFGGVAEAAGKTLGGALDNMSNAVGDAQEALGEQLAPAIITVATNIATAAEKTEDFFDNLSPENIENLKKNAGIVAGMATAYTLYSQGALLARAATIGLMKAAKFLIIFEVINTAVINISQNFDALKRKMQETTLAFQENALKLKIFQSNTGAYLKPFHVFSEELGVLIASVNKSREELAQSKPVEPFDFKTESLEKYFELINGLGDLDLGSDNLKKEIDEYIKSFDDLGNAAEGSGDAIVESSQMSLEESLKNSALQGKLTKEQTIGHIRNQTMKASASHIANIFASVPFPLDVILAAGAQATIAGIFNTVVSGGDNFASGGSFITNKRTTLPIGNGVVVGDNASGMERIDVTPLPSPNQRSSGNITININAPVVDEFVVDSIIPAIRRAEQLNL